MHAISNYRGNRPTNTHTQTHKHTHRQDLLQYTAPPQLTSAQCNQWPPRALFCLKLDNSCCYARYSCGNNCNVVVKLVQECKLFDVFYFRSTETVRRERYVSWGSERLQVSARVKKRTADVVYERCLYCVAYRNFWQCSAAGSWK